MTFPEVYKAVTHCSTEARGHDDVPKSVVTASFPVIGGYLLNIFNTSIFESIFPSVWKKSLVLALNKVSSPRTMGNMRPIALLTFLSKILKRLIHFQISDYVETITLLDPFQTGYREGHSTNTTLLKLTDDIRYGMDRKHLTLLLLFDFSKAFDTVCYVTLLRKLKKLGFANYKN